MRQGAATPQEDHQGRLGGRELYNAVLPEQQVPTATGRGFGQGDWETGRGVKRWVESN